MFDWYLFLIILFFSIPGIIINIPIFLRKEISESGESWIKKSIISFLSTIYSIIRNVCIIAIFISVGVLLNPLIKSKVPVFIAIIKKKDLWQTLRFYLLLAILFGFIGAVLFIYIYYIFLRLKINKNNIAIIEDLRMKRYLTGRIIYDGMIHEIILRWGVLSSIIWGINTYFNEINIYLVLVSLFLLGSIVGLFKLLVYFSLGAEVNRSFVALVFISEIILSLFFGFIFWFYGLATVILSHMIFSLLWHPFDVYCYNQRKYKRKR